MHLQPLRPHSVALLQALEIRAGLRVNDSRNPYRGYSLCELAPASTTQACATYRAARWT
jgi:hypothetical protein